MKLLSLNFDTTHQSIKKNLSKIRFLVHSNRKFETRIDDRYTFTKTPIKMSICSKPNLKLTRNDRSAGLELFLCFFYCTLEN